MILAKVGESAIRKMGATIPENAAFPPWVKDVESGIKALNIAYHMNHMKNGKIMYNQDTHALTDGIGDILYKKTAGKNEIIVECRNPYPCSFELGIITAMASKFEALSKVVHDDSKPCRKKGADSCTYIITW